MPNDRPPLLVHSRHEARHIDQGDQRNVEGIAETDETGSLVGRIDVQRPSHHRGLVGNDSGYDTTDACKADNQVAGQLA